MTEKKQKRSGPGRPSHDPQNKLRVLKLRATDEEWKEFHELKPSNMRKAFEVLLSALRQKRDLEEIERQAAETLSMEVVDA